VPERLRFLVRFNPVRSILEVFRDRIYFGKIPPLSHLLVCWW
jgi:ABC-type polysaccharide/polyol phosphate export permease